MKISKDGVTTTNTPGQFQTEPFFSSVRRRRLVQWDYRDSKGRLFTGIARTIHRARLAAQRLSNETID